MTKSVGLKVQLMLTMLLFTTFLISSCKLSNDSSSSNPVATNTTAVLQGTVSNYLTGNAIVSAKVTIIGGTQLVSVSTDESGAFSAEVELESGTTVTVITTKSGYTGDTTSTYIQSGATVTLDQIQMMPTSTGGGSTPSGDPVSIYIDQVSTPVIGVKESGSAETTQLTFVVVDSAGTPVDLDHSVTVNFMLSAGPGGGEFLSPSSAVTNNLGQASVNLTSGTKAGAVQVSARVNITAGTISSLPVSITIHGGLPDSTHFSIAPKNLNFPGYNIFGLIDQITAFVGDKYANPVRSQTAVYFTTSGGIIEGSALTNDQGMGTVNLISAEPRPIHQTYGPGYATVTASTVNENSQTISTNTIVLFSGVPVLSVDPTSFNIPNGGSQNFTYTVSDQNGNPLVSGTNITVAVSGESVDASGDLSITLPDTQDRGWTLFGFNVYDKVDTVDVAKSVSIKISTEGPNGSGHITIQGTSH